MTRAMPLPANLPENSFTLRRARSLGLRRSRLRAKDLLIPSRDIRLRRDAEPVLAERCRPYLDLLPDAFLSHVTAARLHGLPLPRPLQSEPTIHLSRASTLAVPRRRNVTGHRLLLESAELTVCSGLPVTSLARTLLDLSTVLSLEDLVAAGDWGIQLGWHQVRINKFDVAQGPAWVVGKVRQALVRGGWTP